MTAEQPRALIDNFKIPLRPIPEEPSQDFFRMTRDFINRQYQSLHPDADISKLTPEGMQVALVKDRVNEGKFVEALEFALGKHKSIISPEEWREALLNSPPEAQPSLEEARKVALDEQTWQKSHPGEPRVYERYQGTDPMLMLIEGISGPFKDLRDLKREKLDLPLHDLRFGISNGMERAKITMARSAQNVRNLASQARALVKG